MATLQSTLNELHTLNQITNNVAVAGITFDAIQLVEAQKARITELEAEVEDLTRNKMVSEHGYGKRIVGLESKLIAFACEVLGVNECEQESEEIEKAFNLCLDSALNIIGRVDS